jgi:uncharacterized protein
MSKTFVKDPRAVAKPGDVVRVKVLEVDAPRKRISLTLRLDDAPGAQTPRGAEPRFKPQAMTTREEPRGANAFADALRKAAEKGTPKR